MFANFQTPIEIPPTCDELLGGGRVVADWLVAWWDGQEAKFVYDFDASQARERIFTSPLIGDKLRYLAIESGMTLTESSEFTFVSQLASLQGYRHKLACAVRSINQELQSLDLFKVAYGRFALEAPSTEKWDSSLYWNQSPVCLPSLHLANVGLAQGDVRLYTAFDWATYFNMREALSRLKIELRAIGATVALLQKVFFSGISFFCSVLWERRRWFLHHGSHPPKQTVKADLSLFTEVCSRSLIA